MPSGRLVEAASGVDCSGADGGDPSSRPEGPKGWHWQRLRYQYLYVCTSKASKLSTWHLTILIARRVLIARRSLQAEV